MAANPLLPDPGLRAIPLRGFSIAAPALSALGLAFADEVADSAGLRVLSAAVGDLAGAGPHVAAVLVGFDVQPSIQRRKG